MTRDRWRAASFAVSRMAVVVFVACACAGEADTTERSMVVTVTAYNSVPEQTNDEPTTTAWGDELKPGMKAVAVSPDLLKEGQNGADQIV